MRDVRACAATGALQADTATPLLRCARCRSTHYVDAARQRAHWPAHRRTCLPLGDGEKERVANLKAPRAQYARHECFVICEDSLTLGNSVNMERGGAFTDHHHPAPRRASSSTTSAPS